MVWLATPAKSKENVMGFATPNNPSNLRLNDLEEKPAA